ncbi:ankyrin repeat domain-containing protein 26-like, partial [Psammomys obesus]|uniref:ankyrin repeat domain-containing protein 26-like n=1 Tax=Psammomys obesus TaxID=48139 RepID=UPI002452EF5F
MRKIFWSKRRGLAPGSSSTGQWITCLGCGCVSGDSPEVPRYLTGYCAVGQIHRAASVGAVTTVESFLTFRVNGVNDTDKRNRTALHYACAHGHLGVVTLLIERNCDINACDDDSCTPLIKASQRQHEECVALLLQHGADPNAMDALGNTALHYAVCNDNTFIASQLLEHSANIEAKTKVEEGKYQLQQLDVALEKSDDRTAGIVVSVSAAAAVTSAVSSSNATVSAVVTVAVTAAFEAVTATAEHKGNEPTLQRHSAATNKEFALEKKEEHNKSGKTIKEASVMISNTVRTVLDRSLKRLQFLPEDTFEITAVFGKEELCWSSTGLTFNPAEFVQRCRNIATKRHANFNQVKKQVNILEGLDDWTVPSETASEDCELLHTNDEYALLLEVECLKLEDSVKNQAEEIEEIENQLFREDLLRYRLGKVQVQSAKGRSGEMKPSRMQAMAAEAVLFVEVLKVTEKKLNECENRELYFHEDMRNKTFEILRHEINYLKDTWGPIHCKYLHQDINIQLTEQGLLTIKTDQENYENLHETQGNMANEVLTLKRLFQESPTGKESSQCFKINELEQQMMKLEKMIIQLQRMTCERDELHGILAHFSDKDLNNRFNFELAILNLEHLKVMSALLKLSQGLSEALDDYKVLTKDTDSLSLHHCQLMIDWTKLTLQVTTLRKKNRELQREHIVLQNCFQEKNRLCEEALEKMCGLCAKKQQELEVLEKRLQPPLKRIMLDTQ